MSKFIGATGVHGVSSPISIRPSECRWHVVECGCVLFPGKRNRNVVGAGQSICPSQLSNVHSLANISCVSSRFRCVRSLPLLLLLLFSWRISSAVCVSWRARSFFFLLNENHQSELTDIEFAICRLMIIIIMQAQLGRTHWVTQTLCVIYTRHAAANDIKKIDRMYFYFRFDPMCCVRDKYTHYTPSPEMGAMDGYMGISL